MNKQNTKRTLIGTVVSVVPKTVIVAVVHEFRHPLYEKAVKRTKKFAVHNENTEPVVGDKVEIVETRPISRRKHFMVKGKLG